VNIEFHYYILNVLLRRAGFAGEEARIIAHASQFVDYNIVTYTVDTPRGSYETMATQNYGFWGPETPRNIYVPFHFFPGSSDAAGAARRDGRTNVLSCTPDSPGAKKLLVAALKTRDPYRVGIALHTYADTWAHQNFSGLREDWNSCDDRTLIPPIGHAQVLGSPDKLTERWADPRLAADAARIDNRERFFAAARKIYKYLCTYNHRTFDDADAVMDALAMQLGEPGRERSMEERILDLCIEADIERYDRTEGVSDAVVTRDVADDADAAAGWDKLLWLKDEMLFRSKLMKKKPAPAREGFYSSHFYRFLEAARAHLEVSQEIIAHDLHIAL
jgi:Family of unknown function (DUF6765)